MTGSVAHLAVPISADAKGPADSGAGFLVGAGGGKLDYRGAALVQAYSGRGGGFLAVVDRAGKLSFREHSDEKGSARFAPLLSRTNLAFSGRTLPEDVTLHLSVNKVAGDAFEARLFLRGKDGTLLAEELLNGLSAERIAGGLMLAAVQCSDAGGWRFGIPLAGGDMLSVRPERGLGPVVSTLYSLSDRILKMSAQCIPLGEGDQALAELQVRRGKGAWQTVAKAPVGQGACAQFRVEQWDMSRAADFRVRLEVAGNTFLREGNIAAEPRGRPLRIGLFSCVAATLRALDGPPEPLELPTATATGRFDPNSIIFPHSPLTRGAARQKPDLLVICGDQFYEQFPTRGLSDDESASAAEEVCLDGLYKWLLWCWAFRDLTAGRPTIVLMDDHDYYQPNYWGNGGRAAPERDRNRGGYTKPVEYIRTLERVETGHNPDPFDPSPVDQGISVYYGAFVYGGVSFAILEDRKFKTGVMQGDDFDVYEGQLLGERQERFLREWKSMAPGLPKVVLTQTVWACSQTTPEGHPLIDFDSNGFPTYARRVAVQLVKECKALMLSGDQHMASLVRHGIDTYDDGPLQFTGPAGGVGWQRWFEPAQALPNARPGVPNTGDFVDGFGNKLRMLAVAQPRISLAEYRKYKQGRTQRIMDRALKREGFGMAIVDTNEGTVQLECWPWNSADTEAGSQYPGWPYKVSLSEL
ncbi:hypothetical protein [Novosphingobium aquae]|uniref:PhoD-like phosphatase metallophosphatase domain-containing protein n=1 Tax=Novosphingobium aquae TaxID=3133435 RepID=A0ABU8SA78_9SPHN